MKRSIAALAALMMAFLPFDKGWAASAVLEDVYPEMRVDGKVYSVGRWSDGSYTDAISEYPEQRADGSVVYVYVWNNGTHSIAVGRYSERRADGSIWLVRRWEDGAYSSRQVQAGLPTLVPPSSSPERSATREPFAAFINTFWPISRQLNPCSTRLNALLPTLERREDQIRAIDTWVKCFEPHMPAVAALSAPPVPLVESFVKDYKEAILLEFDAGKRLNWGLVIDQESIFIQAALDLERSARQEIRAFLVLDAAILLYGLSHDPGPSPYGIWY